MQKEFKQILEAIDKWIDANDGEVAFIKDFVSFDKEKSERMKGTNGIIKDDIILGFGKKEILEISLEKLQRSLKEEKKDFIKW